MNGFQAIILICLANVPSDQCTEETATDVLSKHVDNELGCFSGWQDVIAAPPKPTRSAGTSMSAPCAAGRADAPPQLDNAERIAIVA